MKTYPEMRAKNPPVRIQGTVVYLLREVAARARIFGPIIDKLPTIDKLPINFHFTPGKKYLVPRRKYQDRSFFIYLQDYNKYKHTATDPGVSLYMLKQKKKI